MKYISFYIFLAISASIWAPSAHAYPTMVRHGYTTCVTCHFNTSGGGILRSYGKFVAGETMGIFNTSDSALPWLKKPVENEVFSIGFLGRTVQTYYDTPQLRRADFIKMQADLEAALEYKTWIGQVTVGPRLDSAIAPDQAEHGIFVRRFYAGKQDMNYSVKAGKFFPEYGIYVPNHNLSTRKGLFFNHNQEPWNLQGSYFTPSWDFTVAHLRGASGTLFESMNGFSGTVAYKTGSMRYGLSGIRMGLPGSDKTSAAASLFGTIGYSGLGYTLVEVARKSVTNLRGHTSAFNNGYFETGWEFYKGLIPFINWDYSQNATTHNLTHSPGIGLQCGPITHVEILAQISALLTPSGNGYSVFSMFNVYF